MAEEKVELTHEQLEKVSGGNGSAYDGVSMKTAVETKLFSQRGWFLESAMIVPADRWVDTIGPPVEGTGPDGDYGFFYYYCNYYGNYGYIPEKDLKKP